MEQYGKDGEFTRIAGIPEDLTGHWSKRRAAIIDAAREMGFTVEGNAPRAAAANRSRGQASRRTMIRRSGIGAGVARRRDLSNARC